MLAQNRVVWHIKRWNPCRRLGCRRLEEPKKVVNMRSEHFGCIFRVYGEKKPLTDWSQFYLGGRYPWCNHACQIWWRSIEGIMGGCGVKVQHFPLTLLVVLTTLTLPCEHDKQWLEVDRWNIHRITHANHRLDIVVGGQPLFWQPLFQ